MMNENRSAPHLRHLGRALQSQIEDTLTCDQCQKLLPDYVQAEREVTTQVVEETRWVAMHNHLALCLYCTAAYEQLQEWLLTSLNDSTPQASAYPDFDLSFLQPPLPTPSAAFTPVEWPRELIQKSRQQGQQWLHDVVAGLYLLFTPAPALAGAGWAVKSGEEEALLARTVLGEEDLPGWEIEATVFATTADLCRVEVSLYTFAPIDEGLAGTSVTLTDGANEHFALTDANGLVEFDAIPRALIGSLVLRVALPTSPDQSGSPISTKGAQ